MKSSILNTNRDIIISIIVTAIIGIFYFNQNIYMLISHNDFPEYFHRAEHWAEGNLLWEGGSDKLLSVIEYIAIKISDKNDFINIYDKINYLILILTLISVYLFLTAKNSFSLPFLVRIFSVLFFCSLPYIIIKANTIDQSYLFGIMLLMWLAVHHIFILSAIIAFLVTLTRPEGVIIIPLFIFILWLDKDNRSKIAFNLSLFILLFIVYKLIDSSYMPSSYGETKILERSYEKYINTDVSGLFKLFTGFLLLPINYLLLALIILKSHIYFAFFTIGVIVSIKEKRYYPYITIPILYLIMLLILSKGEYSQNYNLYNIKIYVLSKVSWFTPYDFIDYYSNDYRTILDKLLETHQAGFPFAQGRYVLFLYPFISIFVVIGVIFIAEKIFSLVQNNKLQQYGLLFTLIIIFSVFLVPNTLKYLSIKDKFQLETPTHHIVPLRQVAIILRKFRTEIDDSVVIYERCNSFSRSQYFASLMTHITAFSGISNIYIKACKEGNALVKGINVQNGRGGLPGTSILEREKELSFINKSLNFKFENMMVDYKYNQAKSHKINQLFKKPSLDVYRDLSIDFVIHDSKTFLSSSIRANLKLLATFENYKIYAVPN